MITQNIIYGNSLSFNNNRVIVNHKGIYITQKGKGNYYLLEVLKAIVLGIVQGITEWLPISSTGHMVLVNEFLKLDVSDEFLSIFLVMIQLGSILAVVIMYWNRIFPFEMQPGRKKVVKKTIRDRYGNKVVKKYRKATITPALRWDVLGLWLRIIVGCIPAVIIGLPFDDLFERLFYKPVPIAIALIVFGVALIVVEIYNKGRRPNVRNVMDISIGMAFIIGIFQLIAAIFPGTSRSGATILGALILGISRVAAAEFTFFMAIPVMFGASLLKILKFALGGYTVSGFEILLLVIGMVVAFVVSVFVIKFLMGYIRRHDYKVFGYYRIVLGLIVLLYFLIIGG